MIVSTYIEGIWALESNGIHLQVLHNKYFIYGGNEGGKKWKDSREL